MEGSEGKQAPTERQRAGMDFPQYPIRTSPDPFAYRRSSTNSSNSLKPVAEFFDPLDNLRRYLRNQQGSSNNQNSNFNHYSPSPNCCSFSNQGNPFLQHMQNNDKKNRNGNFQRNGLVMQQPFNQYFDTTSSNFPDNMRLGAGCCTENDFSCPCASEMNSNLLYQQMNSPSNDCCCSCSSMFNKTRSQYKRLNAGTNMQSCRCSQNAVPAQRNAFPQSRMPSLPGAMRYSAQIIPFPDQEMSFPGAAAMGPAQMFTCPAPAMPYPEPTISYQESNMSGLPYQTPMMRYPAPAFSYPETPMPCSPMPYAEMPCAPIQCAPIPCVPMPCAPMPCPAIPFAAMPSQPKLRSPGMPCPAFTEYCALTKHSQMTSASAQTAPCPVEMVRSSAQTVSSDRLGQSLPFTDCKCCGCAFNRQKDQMSICPRCLLDLSRVVASQRICTNCSGQAAADQRLIEEATRERGSIEEPEIETEILQQEEDQESPHVSRVTVSKTISDVRNPPGSARTRVTSRISSTGRLPVSYSLKTIVDRAADKNAFTSKPFNPYAISPSTRSADLDISSNTSAQQIEYPRSVSEVNAPVSTPQFSRASGSSGLSMREENRRQSSRAEFPAEASRQQIGSQLVNSETQFIDDGDRSLPFVPSAHSRLVPSIQEQNRTATSANDNMRSERNVREMTDQIGVDGSRSFYKSETVSGGNMEPTIIKKTRTERTVVSNQGRPGMGSQKSYVTGNIMDQNMGRSQIAQPKIIRREVTRYVTQPDTQRPRIKQITRTERIVKKRGNPPPGNRSVKRMETQTTNYKSRGPLQGAPGAMEDIAGNDIRAEIVSNVSQILFGVPLAQQRIGGGREEPEYYQPHHRQTDYIQRRKAYDNQTPGSRENIKSNGSMHNQDRNNMASQRSSSFQVLRRDGLIQPSESFGFTAPSSRQNSYTPHQKSYVPKTHERVFGPAIPENVIEPHDNPSNVFDFKGNDETIRRRHMASGGNPKKMLPNPAGINYQKNSCHEANRRNNRGETYQDPSNHSLHVRFASTQSDRADTLCQNVHAHPHS